MQQADTASRALAILEELGNQPATSYYEAAVSRTIRRVLEEAGVSYEMDGYGNIVAHYASTDRNADERPVALVAHMDHPGFEIVEVNGHQAIAQMLGRTSDAVYDQRIPLLIYVTDGKMTRGTTTGSGGQPHDRRLSVTLDGEVTLPAYAVFDLPGFSREGDTIQMRACDDLAGCAATLAVLETLAASRTPTEVYGVFTRAEEEGLIGARLLAAEERLPREALVISVESSRTLPGAEHGKGPVIRVGDAATTFSMRAESILLTARQRLAERAPPVQVQRQLMSGGVCEASAFILQGYEATGLAFPLGHYHNGLGEEGVEAEFISVSDFLGGVDLLLEAVRSGHRTLAAAEEPSVYGRLRARPEAEAQRLRDSRETGLSS